MRNDLNIVVRFEAVPSVPCFELWLLLHFENVLSSLHRTEVYRRLRQHLPDYDKGQAGHYTNTQPYLTAAIERAALLATQFNAHNGTDPYTDIHGLVTLLTTLKNNAE